MTLARRPVRRTEDPRFLTGMGTYIDNLDLEAAHATFVRSIMAHAEIDSINIDLATELPGVLGVFTAATLGLGPLSPEYAGLGVEPEMLRWPLANDRVRFVGEPIAVVVSTTREIGVDAAELVEVDYVTLPPVITVDDAKTDRVLLFPSAGTNLAFDLFEEPSDDLFTSCEVVISQSMFNQRLAPCPLEVRASAAAFGEDGRLTQWLGTQTPHAARTQLAMAYGLEEEQIRVITPDVGGGFGAKIGIGVEELILGRLAALVGLPVRFVETRTESMLAMGHGRAQHQVVEIGGSLAGKIEAYRLTIDADCGAYPRMGAILASMTGLMASGVYDIAAVEVIGASYVTNTCPIVAYRGAGRPEAAAAIERAVDLFALEPGMDPILVRQQNMITAARFPFDTPTGATYDSGNYQGALKRLCDELGIGNLRQEQSARRNCGDRFRLGIGIATYVEVTAPLIDTEWAEIEITLNGTAIARIGTAAQGQGHATTFAMLVADQLGMPLDHVDVRFGDTDEIARGEGTMGSRSIQIGGPALGGAANLVVEKARELAGRYFEAAVGDIVLDRDRGLFHVVGTPARTIGWSELADSAQPEDKFAAEFLFDPEGATFPFGAHGALVEVDLDTGLVKLLRMVAVDDAGTLINPLLAEGQIHGGLAQGIGQALMESFFYDEMGNPKTTNFADYPVISACELPSFEIHSQETPTPLNPLGAKGIGESGTIGSTPAVQNAVIDALSDFGVRHIELPLTPERVWRAINNT